MIRSCLVGFLAVLLSFIMHGCTVTTAPAKEARLRGDSEHRFALLVGIGDYSQTGPADAKARWTKLHGPENDVRAMRELLESPAYGFEVRTLTDSDGDVSSAGTDPEARPTQTAILAAIQEHLGQASPDDVVLFYFSGHGDQVTDQEEEPDERDGLDEALVPWDNTGKHDPAGLLRDDALKEAFARLDAENVVVIFDSCHSGTAIRGGGRPRGRLATDPRPQPAVNRGSEADHGAGVMGGDAARASGTVFLSAARAGQRAFEEKFPNERGGFDDQGVFTHLLVQELWRTNGRGTWRTVTDRVRMRTKLLGKMQEPQAEGAVDREIFGNAWGEVPDYHLAQLVSAGNLRLDAGTLHGLSKGDIISVHPEHPDSGGAEETLGKASITSIDLWSATARPAEELDLSALEAGAGFRVRLEQPMVSLYVPRLDIGGRVPKAVRKALEEMEGVELVQSVDDTPQDAGPGDLVLRLEEDGMLRLRRGDDGPVVGIPTYHEKKTLESISPSHPEVGEFMVQACELDRLRSRFEHLVNEDPDTRLEVGIELVVVNQLPDTQGNKLSHYEFTDEPVARHGTEWQLEPNQTFGIVVENRSEKDVWVTVVELRSDGAIDVSKPLGDLHREAGEDQAPLQSGERLPVRTVFIADEAPGSLGWKLLASGMKMDLSGVDRKLRTRGGPSSCPEAGLGAWLCDIVQDKTRGERADTPVDTLWGTAMAYGRIAADAFESEEGSD